VSASADDNEHAFAGRRCRAGRGGWCGDKDGGVSPSLTQYPVRVRVRVRGMSARLPRSGEPAMLPAWVCGRCVARGSRHGGVGGGGGGEGFDDVAPRAAPAPVLECRAGSGTTLRCGLRWTGGMRVGEESTSWRDQVRPARGGDSVHTTPSHVPVSHVAGFNPECKCRYVPPVVLSPRYNFLSSNTSDSSEWLVLVAGPDSDSLLLGHCFSDIHRAKVHAVLHEVRARCVLSR
jgi:hypothetical protein